jgi:hypothetical protein
MHVIDCPLGKRRPILELIAHPLIGDASVIAIP